MADTAVTISRSKAYNLSLHEQARGFSHKFHVDYSDVAYGSGSSDTVTMTLGVLPSTWVVNNALVNVSTAFAGTTAFTVVVGTTTTTNAFITSTSVKTAGVIETPLTGALTKATAPARAAGSTSPSSRLPEEKVKCELNQQMLARVMAAQGSTQIEGLGQQAARIDARLFFRLQQQHGNQVHEWLPEYLKDNPHLCSKGYRPKVDPSRKGLTGGWMPKNAA